MDMIFAALGKVLRDAPKEALVFAQTHGRDVREFIVLVDEGRVGIRSVAAAGEDVENGDSVTLFEPIRDRDGERKGCVVAVRGEDEDLQGVAPMLLKSYFTGI
jgi:hypothetical protein